MPDSPRFVAIVCHPHPLFGGTLHNHATHRIAKAVTESGGVALRFNFRGVGRTEGKHDEGRGEVDDARVALGWLAENHAPLPRYACGFSFGARVALQAGEQNDVRGILCAGLPIKLLDFTFARNGTKRVAVVQAENDKYGTPEEVEHQFIGDAGDRRLFRVERATHLFTEDLDRLQAQATAALAWLLEETRP